MILVRSTHPGWLSNAYLAAEAPGGAAVFLDSGAPGGPLLEAVEYNRLTVGAILTTHRHEDHVAGHGELAAKTGAPVFALRAEAPFVPGAAPLEDGEERAWGGLRVRVIHLPGHTSGHAGYLVEGIGLFTGDSLFAGSLGGTVGPASSGFQDAERAVRRILELPGETAIHPGHGDPTTVSRELRENPFVRILTGQDPEGEGRCSALGRPARLIVLARDYDGGTKAWVRFADDGKDAIVPGSRVKV